MLTVLACIVVSLLGMRQQCVAWKYVFNGFSTVLCLKRGMQHSNLIFKLQFH